METLTLQIFLFIENKRIPNLAQTAVVISHIHQIQIFNLRHTDAGRMESECLCIPLNIERFQ